MQTRKSETLRQKDAGDQPLESLLTPKVHGRKANLSGSRTEVITYRELIVLVFESLTVRKKSFFILYASGPKVCARWVAVSKTPNGGCE